MAARKRKVTLTDDWKAKIKASQLVNRLYDHALGDIEMTPTQIKAAQVVLNKLVPDLNRSEHTGDGGKPIQHSISVQFVGPEGK